MPDHIQVSEFFAGADYDPDLRALLLGIYERADAIDAAGNLDLTKARVAVQSFIAALVGAEPPCAPH
jgi:hypothetical protein